MTTFVRVLTTHTWDSSPCVLLSSANGNLTLINCGEGCQRSFLESIGLRVKSVTCICLTHLSHSAVGGLPGMILTRADVVTEASEQSTLASAKNPQASIPMSETTTNKNHTNHLSHELASNGKSPQTEPQALVSPTTATQATTTPTKRNKRKATPVRHITTSDQVGTMPGLDIMGPRNTQQFIHSLRHFMRRDHFQLNVREGGKSHGQVHATRPGKKKQGRKKIKQEDQDGFYIESVPCVHKLNYRERDESSLSSCCNINSDDNDVEVLSFVFTTPPIPGKFLPERARELGIPAGPLYGQLKNGKAVTFVHPNTMETKIVESHEVVTTGSPGVAVAVVYCPSLYVLQQVMESSVLTKLTDNNSNGNKERPILEVMIHMAPRPVFDMSVYTTWIQSLPDSIEHVFMESPDSIVEETEVGVDRHGSPFHAASLGAMTRSLLDNKLYPPVVSRWTGRSSEKTVCGSEPEPVNGSKAPAAANLTNPDNNTPTNSIIVTDAKPDLEFVLIPRSKRGFTESSTMKWESPDLLQGISVQEYDEMNNLVRESGALGLANTILKDTRSFKDSTTNVGEVIFTGTGSAIPCKHRNVTGIYLQMRNGNAMLLDVGESTLGQLFRSKYYQANRKPNGAEGLDFTRALIRNIKAVFISHPHADHHLGILRFLAERNIICGLGVDPIVLMAPPNMFRFLAEYSAVDPRIQNSYIPLDCRDMLPEKRNPLGDKLYAELGITWCVSVPVAHCPHSYALVLDGTAFGRLTYSGDCRPSTRLANVGTHTDLLIHEATFEDGMEEEAAVKRHCTVGEALGVARRMKAKAVVLTHFSQRYPRIPPLDASKVAKGNTRTESSDAKKINDEDFDAPVVFAFDFMTLTPGNERTASLLTPALRLLYPVDAENGGAEGDIDNGDRVQSSAKESLAVPGFFAQKGIL